MEHPNLDSPLEVACAWSAIVEPGDEAAGLLRKSMGSALALEWLLSQPNPAKLPRNLTHDSDGRVHVDTGAKQVDPQGAGARCAAGPRPT